MTAAPATADTPAPAQAVQSSSPQRIVLDGRAGGRRFDGIGVVDGGGGTSVLLKDYPEPQRSQILDLMYRPQFGASVSALLVEVPGDGNSTQGSMPSHMHARDDLNHMRGYTWWVMREARRRNPRLTLDGAAWSAPGWLGTRGPVYAQDTAAQHRIDGTFFSQDTVDYYVNWLKGLRDRHGLEMDALGARNEKGVSYDFVIALRKALDANGFGKVRLHGFDNWQDDWKFDFVRDMPGNEPLRQSLAIIGAHMNAPEYRAPADIQAMAAAMGKPIWNTEQHVYKPGFDGLIGIVQAFNSNYVHSGATKIVNWYGIAGLYEMEPYSGVKEAAVRANWPWAGHYEINPALWGYAHYGQFSAAGWTYLAGANGDLRGGGTFVTLVSPARDYSVIAETKDATGPQTVTLAIGDGLSTGDVAVWRSNVGEQFVRLADIPSRNGAITLTLDPASVYSITTTRGQRKGGFADVPAKRSFPLPYRDTFDGYGDPATRGYLPHYLADIAGAFELAGCPGRAGGCLRQAVGVPPLSWAPNWQPYTIVGDRQWRDYTVGVDIRLGTGERAAVMGRINEVGTGYGYIPKGYLLELAADGMLRLSVARGKEDKAALVGDAEQRALIKASRDAGPGGVAMLAERRLDERWLGGAVADRWHRLDLRMTGDTITGSVDGKPVLTVRDATYGAGMAGLLAGGGKERWSRPFFDNLSLAQAPAGPAGPAGEGPGSGPTIAPLYP
jgi:galactosylceramidase